MRLCDSIGGLILMNRDRVLSQFSAKQIQLVTLNLKLILSQFTYFFQSVNVENPDFTAINGDHFFTCKSS